MGKKKTTNVEFHDIEMDTTHTTVVVGDELPDPGPVEEIVTNVCKQLKVISSRLNLRSEPSKSSKVKSVLNQNENLLFISKANGWIECETNKGIKGFVIEQAVTEV